MPASRLPGLSWRLLGLPAAGLAVVLALSLIQGERDPVPAAPANPGPAAGPERGEPEPVGGKRLTGSKRSASLVNEATFQLALPAGWERVPSADGAAFAAVAGGGFADATLWVSRDAKLDFAAFEARSLAQLEGLAGSAAVVERKLGPTPETTSIKIAPSKAPKGAPRYEVVLRASGRHWYYLATTVQPEAPAATADAVDLIQGSLVPAGAKR